ncbi:MAG: carboxypeptidase regulatory-like domain-containing protein [Candidatus Marinimicrobia bacterium]|nr:carboxypeptidase regulatory-like domain-containing protein [Candidatus Neomarinimicrobiota bacterium]MBT5115881.1 carboxypeptidase regulatory-like domain-containing protein [Candidatus Neomarinimicrobiota bacterium]MBT5748009.1 carboxypeptidase regulatory-like domain-containing protein [Candidatus Neomarinimicrobiota bacterium]MBT6413460.1 carboxypeptidase regulatory-like domain-containing protein [Candidatus Neomarinimicrobiota bacterium]MBT6796541.1 carboxypeptidase regulatory-like domain-
MTLTRSLQKRFVFASAIFMLFGTLVFAKGVALSGRIVDADGNKVKKAALTLLSGGEVVKEDKTGGNGKFKFKKLDKGDYVLQANHEEHGSLEMIITLADNKDIGDVALSTEEKPKETGEVVAAVDPTKAKPERISVTVPQTMEAMGSPSKDFILNELNFEIKKLSAEFKHLSQENDDLKALSKMWVNPLTIYSKEIILKNGSTVFGKIIYQDDKSLKVETLVGYLIIDRTTVVRIVDNVITEDTQEYVPEQIRESYTPPPMPKLAQPRYTSSNNSARAAAAKFSANCVLVGNISEKKDGQGNIIFNGEIKNIGGRRSDFVKVDFVFRKNWSGETKTLTTFVKGSYNTFDTGIVSDASLLPGAIGKFDLYVPQDFGAFIGYSYVIDWEEYQ